MIRLTEKLLHSSGTTGYSGWNKDQLDLLGVPWPPPGGWLKGMVGKDIPDECWRRVMALRGASPGERRKILAGFEASLGTSPKSDSAPNGFAAELEAIRLELREIKRLLLRMEPEEKTCLD